MSLESVRDLLLPGRRAIAFTGAGVSVASGIPDFRSPEGIWARYPVEEYGTIDAFERDPEGFWVFFRELARLYGDAPPNPAHEALARLERLGRLEAVITQNVDGLHAAAGNTDVVGLHGEPDRLVCLRCGERRAEALKALTAAPTCSACGAVMKPDVVLFGEMLPPAPFERALALAASCDVCLVVGTSALVYPAAGIPEVAAERGIVCQFDLAPTDLTRTGRARHLVRGPAEETLPRLVELVEGG